MTTFTDKELIKEIKERIGSLDVRDNIERRAYEIALASLEAEAVMFCISGQNVDSEEHVSTSKAVVDAWVEEWNQVDGSPGEPLYKTMPLYYHAALPAPVVPEEMYWQDAPVEGSSKAAAYATGWNACRAAMLQAEPVSNSDELPLDYLQGHKDGLEWAAQLAEANHPQTGDWLYDDPIDLARAIRKGPDMPTVQGGNSPVTPDGWISCSEQMPEMGERQCYVLAADFKNNYPPNIPNTQVGVYGDWFNDGNPTWDDGDGEDLYLKEVTHWMQLPEPPQEAK
ncbi:TPA: DUF551 domain-containing protein [Escherichia coli]|nr:DUF551 domain-containing protein [Escherichia coli]